MSAQIPAQGHRTIGKRIGLALALALIVVVAASPLAAQTYQDLYDFNCSIGCFPDDYGRLVQGTDGYLYGTAYQGGAYNKGVIFKVSTSGAGYTDLFDFDGTESGYSPTGSLTLASDGNFYGINIGGGDFNNGILYRFNPSLNSFTVLHSFTTTEGSCLVAPVEAKDKNLYGTTQSGTAYRLKVAGGTFIVLPNLAPAIANAPLFQASDGYLYGTSQSGGSANLGTIYRMTTSGKIQIVHNFLGTDGALPIGPLTQATNGMLYGTTSVEGSGNDGTVFQFDPATLTLTTLYSFSGSDGNSPSAGLLAASDGFLYGDTTFGGTYSEGTLFQITTGGTFTKLFDFSLDGEGGVGGTHPSAALVEHTNGTFYGVTDGGGVNNEGVFYSLTPLNLTQHITLCCNWWVILDQPVKVLGQNLTGVISVSFGGVPAQFHVRSDSYLTANVPSGALDAPITVTLATGAQLQSAQSVHILPKIINLDPPGGQVGSITNIVGGGFANTSKVTFGGVPASTFTVISPSLIQVTVPAGALTGKVGVLTPNGTAKSKQTFTVN